MSEFEAGVGLSRKWDAREAGIEVVKDTLDQLEKRPDFILLFSTAHYQDHGGFKNLLEGANEALPDKTPLIGGTITGFVTGRGVFARGVTALAVSYDDLDVIIAKASKTKRQPNKAGRVCGEKIRENLEDSQYNNKFVFDLIAGFKIPEMPGLPRKSVVKSKFMSNLMYHGVKIFKFLGEEEKTLESFKNELKDFHLLHASTTDDFKAKAHFQFYNKEVLTDSIVALGIATDLDLTIGFSHGLSAKEKFAATDLSKNRRFIKKINDLPASKGILDLLEWPADFISPKRIFNTVTYFPLGFKEKGGDLLPRPFTFILGSKIGLMSRFEEDEGYVLTGSGKNMVDAATDTLKQVDNPLLPISVSCSVRFATLGPKCDKIKKSFVQQLGETPFLIVYAAGEALGKPDSNDISYLNECIASTIFHKEE